MQHFDERSMFYGAKPDLFEKAKQLRENMTEAEDVLWEKLRRKQVLGYRFKPQHPIALFIADFYCHALKLVIKVDGGVHLDQDQQCYDEGRTAELEELGIQVIRFSNEQVLGNIGAVITAIEKVCQNRRDEICKRPLWGV